MIPSYPIMAQVLKVLAEQTWGIVKGIYNYGYGEDSDILAYRTISREEQIARRLNVKA